MSHINISLSANTAQYVKRLKEAKTQTDRNIIMMEQRIDKFANQVSKDFTSVSGSVDSMVSGLRMIKGGGYVAAVAAIGIAGVAVAKQIHQMNLAVLESEKALKKVSLQMRESTEETQNIGAAVGSVGVSLEKMGDMSKDVYDKLGDYISTGGGAFQDFVDVVGKGSAVTADSLQKMSSIEILSAMVSEMERVGASASQMTFVMESMASDSSDLLPLLENGARGFKKLKERMDELNATPLLLAETAEEIGYLDTASNRFWDNFKLYATESVAGAYTPLSEFFTWANNKLSELNNENRSDAFISNLKVSKNLEIDTSISTEEAQNRADTLKDYLGKSQSDRVFKEAEKEIAAKKKKLESLRASTHNSYTLGGFRSKDIAAYEKQIAEDEQKLIKTKERLSDWEKLQKDYQRLADVKGGLETSGTSYSKEAASKISGGSLDDDLKSDFNNSLQIRETALGKVLELDAQIAQTQLEIAEESNKAIQEVLQKRLNQEKAERDSQANLAEEHSKKMVRIEKKLADDKEKARKEAENKAKQAQQETHQRELQAAQHKINLSKTESEKILSNRELQDARYRQLMEKGEISKTQFDLYKLQNEKQAQEALSKIVWDQSLNRLQMDAKAAITKQEQAQANYDLEMVQLKSQLEKGKLTREQFDDLEFKALQSKHQLEYEAKEEAHLNEHYATLAREESNMAFLIQSLESKRLTQEQYDQLELASKKATQEAKNAIAMTELDAMSAAMSGLARFAEEGSKQQKAILLAEKSAAIASLSIQQWEKWGTAKTWGEKASVIAAYTGALASVASVTMGQFHSGSDEVDKTGSYILKQGERVVQPEANKDLTAYLNSNKKGGANTSTIKSDLVIQGDTTISEEKFTAMLVQHRENLAQALKLAQRENPNLR
ncbi:hypothetical protein AB6Q85_002326 [Vibrio cholerae]